jgi:hypothetical protein
MCQWGGDCEIYQRVQRRKFQSWSWSLPDVSRLRSTVVEIIPAFVVVELMLHIGIDREYNGSSHKHNGTNTGTKTACRLQIIDRDTYFLVPRVRETT